MFVVNDDQIKSLSAESYETLFKQYTQYLREEFPVDFEMAGEEAAIQEIQVALSVAPLLGIFSSSGVAKLLYLFHRLGANFDIDPDFAWIHDTLKRPSCSPEQGLDLAFDRLADRVRQGLPLRMNVPADTTFPF